MEFNLLDNLQEVISKTIKKQETKDKNIDIEIAQNIDKTKIDLAKKLNAIQEFSIDRFEKNFAVLENRDTREIINIEKEKIPKEAKEGDVLKCISGEYFLDKNFNEQKRKEIKDKMDNLWE